MIKNLLFFLIAIGYLSASAQITPPDTSSRNGNLPFEIPNSFDKKDTLIRESEIKIIFEERDSTNYFIPNSFITADNFSICGRTSVSLKANPASAEYTYQWYYSNDYTGPYNILAGATDLEYKATQKGYYKVLVNDNKTAPALSGYVEVKDRISARLTTMDGQEFTTVQKNLNSTTDLKVILEGGTAPYTFTLSENGYNAKEYKVMENPYILSVKPTQNTQYQILMSSTCAPNSNSNYSFGQIKIVVDNTTDFVFQTPTKLDVCAGETIQIPYSQVGTWNGLKSVNVNLQDSQFQNVNNSYQSSLFTNPLEYTLPSDLPVGGKYSLRVNVTSPNIGYKTSPYVLNVVSAGCKAKATIQTSKNIACGEAYLSASPYINGAKYEWYKDGQLIKESNQAYFYTQASGSYQVKITSTDYTSISASYFITIKGDLPKIESENLSLCGNNGEVTLTTSALGRRYQWQLYENGPYVDIDGETRNFLKTKRAGNYRVKVFTDECDYVSASQQVFSGSSVYLSSDITKTNSIKATAGSEVIIKASIQGSLPARALLYNEKSELVDIQEANQRNIEFRVRTTYSSSYYVRIEGICDDLGSSNFYIDVIPEVSFSLPLPKKTTICNNEVLKIPIKTTGNWPLNKTFFVELINIGSGSRYSETYSLSNNTDSLALFTSFPAGNYKVKVSSQSPYIEYSKEATYTINITNSNCPIFEAFIKKGNENYCSNNYFEAYPQGSNYEYVWYLNNNVLSNSSYYLYPYTPGKYKVRVRNKLTNETSTSVEVVINTINPPLPSPVLSSRLCEATGITLTASAGDSYQWYYYENGTGYVKIQGATGQTYITQRKANHRVRIMQGNCSHTTDFNCDLQIDLRNSTVCQESAIEVYVESINRISLNFKLVDASTNREVANLGFRNANRGKVLFQLPKTVLPGTYKIKGEGLEDNRIFFTENLTVTSSKASKDITIVSALDSYGSNALKAEGCDGLIRWEHTSSTSSVVPINSSSTTNYYRAYCESASVCNSKLAEFQIEVDCADSYEPNDTKEYAKELIGDNLTASNLCFDWLGDEDWFFTFVNNKKYYLKVNPRSNYSVSASSTVYNLKKTFQNNKLTFEVIFANENYYNVSLTIYDENLNVLKTTSLYEKIVSLEIEDPCKFVKILEGTNASGSNKTVQAKGIVSKDKNENQSQIGYEATNFITLEPGFETKISTGGSFKAEIKNCQ